jgi:carbon storage regulator
MDSLPVMDGLFLFHGRKEFMMLVLSRKVNETILMGDDIRITVVRISPYAVRIGITAPEDIKIIREEIGPFERRRENGASHQGVSDS